jgi:hypothetical protein
MGIAPDYRMLLLSVAGAGDSRRCSWLYVLPDGLSVADRRAPLPITAWQEPSAGSIPARRISSLIHSAVPPFQAVKCVSDARRGASGADPGADLESQPIGSASRPAPSERRSRIWRVSYSGSRQRTVRRPNRRHFRARFRTGAKATRSISVSAHSGWSASGTTTPMLRPCSWLDQACSPSLCPAASAGYGAARASGTFGRLLGVRCAAAVAVMMHGLGFQPRVDEDAQGLHRADGRRHSARRPAPGL